jgi:hypothetical protein
MWWLDAADMIAGLTIGILWTKVYYKPVLPVKVTVLPPEPDLEELTVWRDAVKNVVIKLEVSATFGGGLVLGPKGAKDVGMMIKTMAKHLDQLWSADANLRKKVLTTS